MCGVLALFQRKVCLLMLFLFILETTVEGVPSKFEKLNQLLSSLTIPLPDVHVATQMSALNIKLDLKNITCTGLNMSGINALSSGIKGETGLATEVSLSKVAVKCKSKYFFSLDGNIDSGDMTAVSKNSSLVISLDLHSSDFRLHPPSNATINKCVSNIVVDDMHFSGKLQAFEPVLLPEVNKKINFAVCNISRSASDGVTSILKNISHILGGSGTGMTWRKKEEDTWKQYQDKFTLLNIEKSEFFTGLHWFADQVLNKEVCGRPIGINGILNSALKKFRGQPFPNISLAPVPLIKLENNAIISATINLTSVGIEGLDTFTEFDIFRPVSKLTLNHTFHLRKIRLHFGLDVLLEPKTNSTSKEQYKEHVVVTLPEFHDLTVQLSTLLAIDEDFLGGMPLAALVKHLESCTVRGIHAVELTAASISMNTERDQAIDLHGMISDQVDRILNVLLKSLSAAYDRVLFDRGGIQNIFNRYLNPMISKGLGSLLNKAHRKAIDTMAVCNSSAAGPEPLITVPIDFPNSFPIIILSGLIDNILFPVVNDFLANATCGLNGEHGRYDQSGFLLGPSTLHIKNYDHEPQIGNVTVAVSNLTIEHINTISSLKAFDTYAKEPTRLLLEKVVFAPEKDVPLRVSANFELRVKRLKHVGGQNLPDVKNLFRAGLSLNNLTVISDIILSIDSYRIGAMPLRSVGSLNCWLGIADDFQILEGLTALSSSINSVDLTCSKHDILRPAEAELGCTSSSMPEWIALTKNKKFVGDFNRFLDKNITDWILGKFTTAKFRSHMREVLQQKRALGFDKCYETPFFPPDPVFVFPQCIPSKGILLAYSTLCSVALIYYGILFLVKYFQHQHARNRCRCENTCISRCCSCVDFCQGKCPGCQACFNLFCFPHVFCKTKKSNVKDLDYADRLVSSNPYSLLPNEKNDQEENGSLSIEPAEWLEDAQPSQDFASREALVQHPAIPKNVRFGMLVLIGINICLFFTDHALTAAHVDVLANVLGDHYHEHEAFPFGLGYSLVNLWNACAILLVGFMATLSGAWPYLKLLLMTALWCAPPSMLSPKLRGEYFHYLDILGKWSLIDLYVLVNAMVAFYVEIKSPSLDILPENFYDMQILAKPVYGLYSFCCAVILSLALSHVQVIYHLDAVTADKWSNRGKADAKAIEKSLLGSDYYDDASEGQSWLVLGSQDDSMVSVADIVRAHGAPPASFGDKGSLNLGSNVENVDFAYRKGRKYNCISKQAWFLKLKSSRFGVGILVALAMISMIVGICLPGWTFTTHGLAGILGEFGENGSTVRTHNIMTAFAQLLHQSYQGSGFGTIFIALIYIGFGCIVPLMNLSFLCFLWYKRMTLYNTKKMFLVVQILNAFSALEVWFFGTCFTIYQIQFISYSVLDSQCTFLKPTFNALVDFGIILPEDGNCFQIDGEFHWFGLGLICVSCSIGYFVSGLVLEETHYAVKHREMVALKCGNAK